MFVTFKMGQDQLFGKCEPSFIENRLNIFYQRFIYVLFGIQITHLLIAIFLLINFTVDHGLIMIQLIFITNRLGVTIENKIPLYYIFQKGNSNSVQRNEIYYYKAMKNSNQLDKFLLIGIIENHLKEGCILKNYKNQLPNTQIRNSFDYCFCQNFNLYDSKHKLQIACTSQSILSNFNSFLIFQIKTLYQQLLFEDSKNNQVRLQYAKFLFFSLRNITLGLKQMVIIQTNLTDLTIIEKINFNIALKGMKKYMQIQNERSYQSKIDFEKVIYLESIVRKLKLKINNINQNYLRFWRQVSSCTIQEEELLKLDNLISSGINDSNQLFLKLSGILTNQGQASKNYLNQRQQWVQLNIWFKKYILNQKIKTEIDGLPHVSLEYNEEGKFFDSTSGSEEEFDSRLAFDSRSIILFASENGKITKQSENAKEILSITNIFHIDQIIPYCLQRNHMLSIQKFIKTGRSKQIYNRNKIFLQDQNNRLVPAFKYLKVQMNPQTKILEFIAMIRPLQHSQSHNFIILNEDWEIVALTEELEGILEQNFNIALACPKLFLISSFQQYLNKDDMDIFHIKQQGKSKVKKNSEVETNSSKEDIEEERLFTDLFVEQNEIEFNQRQQELNNNKNNQYEQYLHLVVRVPQFCKRMQTEYQNLITNADQENFIDFPEDTIMKKCSFIIRKNAKFIGFDQKILLYKIQFLQNLKQNSKLEAYRYLYNKYFSKADQLKKIIKIEAKIKFENRLLIDKVKIIKIMRFEIITNVKSKRQSMFFHDKTNGRFALKKLPQKVQFFDQIDYYKSAHSPSLECFISERSKYLLNETDFIRNFNNIKNVGSNFKQLNNLFIKEDGNKMKKKSDRIHYFKWTNRYFMVGMILLTMISYSHGPNQSQNQLEMLGVNSSYSFFILSMDISIAYNLLLDVSLCNLNKTFCENLISYTDLNYQKNQSYSKLRDLTHLQLELLQFYQNQNQLITLYSTNNQNGNTLNNTQNLIDDLKMFQVVINQVSQEDLTNITFDFEYLLLIQQTMMPKFFESVSEIQKQQLNFVITEFEFRSMFFLFDMIGGFLFLGMLMVINFFHLFKIIDYYQTLYSQIQYFDHFTIDSVIQYYLKSKLYLNYLHDPSYTNESNLISFQSEGLIKIEESESKLILGFKNRKFQISNYWFKMKLRFLLLYFICMALLITMALTYNIMMQLFAYNVKLLITSNSFLFEVYNSWSFIFSKELLRESELNIHNIRSNYYELFLQSFIDNSVNINYLDQHSNNENINDYFVSNICLLLQLDGLYCNQLCDGILTRGLVQIYHYIGLVFQAQLSKNQTAILDVTLNSIYALNQVQPFLFQANKNIWKIFIKDFSDLFQYYISTETQLIICFYVFSLFIYLLTLEYYFEKQLREDFMKVRSYYKRYFPNNILNEQKRIKQLLKNLGFIG